MDERQRYLKQQAELGGAEVVFSRKATEFLARAPVAAADGKREGGNAPPAQAKTTVREVPQLQDTGQIPAVARPAQPPAAPSTQHPSLRSGQAPAPGTRRPIAAAGSWLKNAPPIPGPGMSFDPPDTYPELATLDAVAQTIAGCRKCALCEGRAHTVPGEGDPTARFLVCGEGPGATEDETGRPFVGRAGDLLEDILAGIGIPRAEAFILNTVKCRPPSNRTPLPDELAACLPYLHRQVALIRPKVILAAGSTAIAALLQTKKSLGQLRGQVHRYAGIPVIATYHPAALLRNPNWKKPTWDDVRIARQLLDA